LRKHVPLQIKQEKHQMEHQGAPDSAKGLRSNRSRMKILTLMKILFLKTFLQRVPLKRFHPLEL